MSQRWIGPFVGLDAEYQFCCDWTLHGTYEFHWSEYHASEKNLFNDYIAPFGSYTVNSKCQGRNNIHGNHAYGNLLNLGLKWNVCDCWTVGVRGEFKWWYVDDARESRKIKTDCCGDTEIKTYFSSKVKEINWCSASVIVDASLSF